MGELVHKNFDKPDETRPFTAGTGHLDLIDTASGGVGRALFEPGWRWSMHIKPIVGTESCQAHHTGYVVSGRMKIVMDEGGSAEIGPGDFIHITPGHDAWVLGDDPCVVLDWTGYADYAKPAAD